MPLGIFKPENNLSLAELAKITHVLAGIDENKSTGRLLNRSAQDEWFKQVARSAEELGWVLFLDASVDLNRPATRGEVMLTFLQALNIPLEWARGDVFSDVSLRTPHASAIETAAHEGFVSGTTVEGAKPLFNPEKPVNRAEMAKIITTMIKKLHGSEATSAPSARGRF